MNIPCFNIVWVKSLFRIYHQTLDKIVNVNGQDISGLFHPTIFVNPV